MDENLNQINTQVYKKLQMKLTNFVIEQESSAYAACRFDLDLKKVISRNSKITPKKPGQFVTFWKRETDGIIPFNTLDAIDFLVVNARLDDRLGQFVFPKKELIKRGILSTELKEGKRGFRVYCHWDKVQNKQAQLSQHWQLAYFYEINNSLDLEYVNKLYQ